MLNWAAAKLWEVGEDMVSELMFGGCGWNS